VYPKKRERERERNGTVVVERSVGKLGHLGHEIAHALKDNVENEQVAHHERQREIEDGLDQRLY